MLVTVSFYSTIVEQISELGTVVFLVLKPSGDEML